MSRRFYSTDASDGPILATIACWFQNSPFPPIPCPPGLIFFLSNDFSSNSSPVVGPTGDGGLFSVGRLNLQLFVVTPVAAPYRVQRVVFGSPPFPSPSSPQQDSKNHFFRLPLRDLRLRAAPDPPPQFRPAIEPVQDHRASPLSSRHCFLPDIPEQLS